MVDENTSPESVLNTLW